MAGLCFRLLTRNQGDSSDHVRRSGPPWPPRWPRSRDPHPPLQWTANYTSTGEQPELRLFDFAVKRIFKPGGRREALDATAWFQRLFLGDTGRGVGGGGHHAMPCQECWLTPNNALAADKVSEVETSPFWSRVGHIKSHFTHLGDALTHKGKQTNKHTAE